MIVGLGFYVRNPFAETNETSARFFVTSQKHTYILKILFLVLVDKDKAGSFGFGHGR